MEFIFQLFAQMLGNDTEAQHTEVIEPAEVHNVAEYQSDAPETPQPIVNIFEYVNFH